ncbi:MAG: DinB family protein [bacterium]
MTLLILQTPTHLEHLFVPVLLFCLLLWLILYGARHVHNWWKGQSIMRDIIDELSATVRQTVPQLQKLTERDAGEHRVPGKWSKKEILGHLIDSASNNHQRFVRIQLSSELRMPDYDQEVWVATQNYQSERWEQLVQFWHHYNLHLIHVLHQIPDKKLGSVCFVGQNEPITFDILLKEYVEHLNHHLDQILIPEEPI